MRAGWLPAATVVTQGAAPTARRKGGNGGGLGAEETRTQINTPSPPLLHPPPRPDRADAPCSFTVSAAVQALEPFPTGKCIKLLRRCERNCSNTPQVTCGTFAFLCILCFTQLKRALPRKLTSFPTVLSWVPDKHSVCIIMVLQPLQRDCN